MRMPVHAVSIWTDSEGEIPRRSVGPMRDRSSFLGVTLGVGEGNPLRGSPTRSKTQQTLLFHELTNRV